MRTEREKELRALPDMLSVAEAAQAARVCPLTICRAIKAGKLKKNDPRARRWAKVSKESLIVFISGRETPAPVAVAVPAQHDAGIFKQYEDPELRRCEQAEPESSADPEQEQFLKDSAYYASLLPPVERKFIQQHPAPFDFKGYFDAPKR